MDITGGSRWVCCLRKAETPFLQGRYMPKAQLGPHHHEPWVTSSLEATATRFLKRWSGLAKPVNTARLYLPRVDGGLALPSISLLYKRLKVSQATLFLTSRDRVTQAVARWALQVEEKQVRVQFKPTWQRIQA